MHEYAFQVICQVRDLIVVMVLMVMMMVMVMMVMTVMTMVRFLHIFSTRILSAPRGAGDVPTVNLSAPNAATLLS